jgi:uncharacterized protein YkwD
MTTTDDRPLIYATAPLAGADIDHTQTDALVLAAMNRERLKRGLPALESHPALKSAAERHGADLARRDELDHFGSDRSNWAERCWDAGYPGASLMTIGENVAGWQVSAEQAVSDWMQSPGHRAAILGQYQHAGSASGTARSGRSYWVTDFGRTP